MRTIRWYILGGLLILACTGALVYAERGEFIALALFMALVGIGVTCFVVAVHIATVLARRLWR